MHRRIYTLVLLACSLLPLPCAAMTFQLVGNGGNCNGCEWVAAEGEISSDTPQQFTDFAKLNGFPSTVFLNSPGGNLLGGVRLGEKIRQFGYETAVGKTQPLKGGALGSEQETVDGICASACAYAFLGGIERKANAKQVGVHQFYQDSFFTNPVQKAFTPLDLSANQFTSALLIDYVFRMGVDPRLVSIASQTTPGQIHFFTAEELETLKVNWRPHEFEPWAIEPYGNGVVAYSRSRDGSETATIFCKRDKTMHLLITAPVLIDRTRLEMSINSLGGDGLMVMGMHIAKEQASVKIANGTNSLQIDLGSYDSLRSLLKNDFRVSGDIPRVNASYFDFPLSNAKGNETVRVAAKNCI